MVRAGTIAVDFNTGSYSPLVLAEGTGDPPNGNAAYTVTVASSVARHIAPTGTVGTVRQTGCLQLPASTLPISGDLTVEWVFPAVGDLAALGNNRTAGIVHAGLWLNGQTGQWTSGLWCGYYWSTSAGVRSAVRQGTTTLAIEPFTATTSAAYRVVKSGTTVQLWASYDGGAWHQVGGNVAIPLATGGTDTVAAAHVRVQDSSGGAMDVAADDFSWTGTGISPPTTNYSLTATAGPNGSIDPTTGTYSAGSLVALTATPEAGYRVAAWSGTDDDQSLASDNTVTMDGNRAVSVTFTQDTVAGFPFGFGAVYVDYSKDMTTDGSGNLYVTGYFQGTVDFDPGAGVITRTAQGDPSNPTTGGGAVDIFLAKFSPAGRLEWLRTFGGSAGADMPHTVRLDPSGNVFLVGYFSGLVDFDTSAGTRNLDAGVGRNIFLSKYDPNGKLLWALGMGDVEANGTDEDPFDEGNDLAIDSAGNVYMTAFFNGTIDLDPSDGQDAGDTFTSNGSSRDIVVASYGPSGNFRWGFKVGGSGQDHGHAIRVDSAGNVYVSGFFSGTVDFDPGTGVSELTATGASWDIFLAKYSSSGGFLWAKRMGGTGADQVRPGAMEVCPNHDVIIGGSFSTTVDFDPGASVRNLVSNGSNDNFIARYDGNGSLQWAIAMGGTGLDFVHRVAIDVQDSVYATGSFVGNVDFDPGAGVATVAGQGTGGASDVFVAKYTSQGDYVWAYGFGAPVSGSTELTLGTGISVDPSGNVFAGGRFHGTADFAPGSAVQDLVSAGSADVFVLRVGAADNTGSNALTVDSVTVDPSASLASVTVSLDVGTDLSSLSFTLGYDPAYLSCSVAQITPATGHFAPGVTDSIVKTVDDTIGLITWSVYDLLGGTVITSGNGSLVTIQFVLRTGFVSGTKALDLGGVSASDAVLQIVGIPVQTDGAVTVQDTTAPTVMVSSSAASPTNVSPIPVTVQFSEGVTGFAVEDVTVVSGSAGSFAAVDADTYTLSVTPAGDGLVEVSVAAGIAQDSAGNANAASNTLSVSYDATLPTVTVSSSAASSTNVSPIPVTVQFSEGVTGFAVQDVTVVNGTAGGFAAVDADTYTLSVTPAGDGLVEVSVAAGIAQDSAGNANAASNTLSVTYDSAPATVRVTPEAVDFGDVRVSTVALRNVLVTNQNDGTESIQAVTVDRAEFAVATFTATLAAGEWVVFPVAFAPAATGDVAAELSIEGAGWTCRIAVTGSGTGNPDHLRIGSVESAPLSAGDTGTVDVFLDSEADLGRLSFTLQYDGASVECTGFVEAPDRVMVTPAGSGTNGTTEWTLEQAGNGPAVLAGSGWLGTLVFRALQDTDLSVLQLRLTTLVAQNPATAAVRVAGQNGEIMVGVPPDTDVDHDGVIDFRDVVFACRHFFGHPLTWAELSLPAGESEETLLARVLRLWEIQFDGYALLDVDMSGSVEFADLVFTYRRLVGQPTVWTGVTLPSGVTVEQVDARIDWLLGE